jgi:hypothetical protein
VIQSQVIVVEAVRFLVPVPFAVAIVIVVIIDGESRRGDRWLRVACRALPSAEGVWKEG